MRTVLFVNKKVYTAANNTDLITGNLTLSNHIKNVIEIKSPSDMNCIHETYYIDF